MSNVANKKTIKKKPLGNPGISQSQTFVWIVAILVLTIIVFSKGITKILIGLDDPVYVTDNPFIKSLSWTSIQNIFSTFYNGNYHPFTTLLYAIEYKLFGNDATYYHIISLIFHLINIILVYIFIEKLSKNKWFAIAGSMIFAIHPMHVESVVWISEQKDVLYSFFYLAGLISYLKYLQQKNYKYLIFTFFLFLFSLFSKSAAVTFPLILVLTDYLNKRSWNTKNILEKIPFFILSLLFGILAINSQNAAGAINDVTMVVYSPLQRIFVVCYAATYYIFKFFIPIDLSVLHYAPKTIPAYFYVCPLVMLLITWFTWKNKINQRKLIYGWLFYILSIILVIQIIPVGFVLVSERYSYLAYIGLLFLIGTILINYLERKNSFSDLINKFGKVILIIVALTYSYISFDYINNWKSSVALFTDIVKKNPNSGFAYHSLGKIQNQSGDPEKAVQSFTEALKLDSTIAEAYFVRGNIYFSKKNYDEAEKDYLKAEKLIPNYPENLNNLAFLYSEKGEMQKAINYYSKAINSKTEEHLFLRRATCYTFLKNYSDALKDYSKAIEINPFNAESYFNRGVCFYYVQQMDKACVDWEKASSLKYEKANSLLGTYCK